MHALNLVQGEKIIDQMAVDSIAKKGVVQIGCGIAENNINKYGHSSTGFPNCKIPLTTLHFSIYHNLFLCPFSNSDNVQKTYTRIYCFIFANLLKV